MKRGVHPQNPPVDPALPSNAGDLAYCLMLIPVYYMCVHVYIYKMYGYWRGKYGARCMYLELLCSVECNHFPSQILSHLYTFFYLPFFIP